MLATASGSPRRATARAGRRRRSVGARRRRPGAARRAHGTIFSIGRTRIPDAPAALSRGSRPQTSSAPTTEWIAIMPSWASGMTVGDSSAGQEASSSASCAGRRVHHQVLAAARGDDGAEHRVDGGEVVGALALRRSGWRRGSPRESRTSPIWRRPFMTSVEPVETRSTIASARPSRGATSTAPEIGMISTAMPRSSKKRRAVFGWAVATRRPARSSTVWYGAVVRDGGGQPAAAVAERRGRAAARRRSRSSRSMPVMPEVGDAVADELDDVVRAHEQDVEVEVLDARDEAPVVLLEDEAGVVEQARGSARRAGPCWGRPGGGDGHRSPATG